MKRNKPVNYAVVGLGHISQVAVLPAFAHAKKNSRLAALVTGDPGKASRLARQYGIPAYGYDEYEECLRTETIDAVYIALPNHLHREYAVRAARAGVHILCEKPMAVTEKECQSMIAAAQENDVRLMIAYRLHFEEANLEAIRLIQGGKIGEPRIFNSVFSMQVKPDNIRIEAEMGGGTLFDLGIYCINAARYLFRDEPTEVIAASASGRDKRFAEVDEMTSAVLRFPGERLAVFTSSFGAAPAAVYQILGTKGDIRVEQAYEYVGERTLIVTRNEKEKTKRYSPADQFAPELLYFSDCVRRHREPEPSGREGLVDVRIIEALYRSAREGRSIQLTPISDRYPSPKQLIKKPAVKKPDLVRAKSASQ